MPKIPSKTSTGAYKAIPDPIGFDPSLYDTVVALKEVVELLTRQRKPFLSAAVTFQDLTDLGITGSDGRGMHNMSDLRTLLEPPQFYMRLLADQAATGDTKIEFDNFRIDNYEWWDATNFRYIPKLPGSYLVILSAYADGPAETRIKISGSSRTTGTWFDSLTGIGEAVSVATHIVQANGTTDYIEGFCRADTTIFEDHATFMQIIRVSSVEAL